MKTLLIAAFAFGVATTGLADIQDPPSNDYGPTRKLGRGLSNLVFGISELPATIAKITTAKATRPRPVTASAAGLAAAVYGWGRAYSNS